MQIKMNDFDAKAIEWDLNPMHQERSAAIVNKLLQKIPMKRSMTALEFGAGTGITSFLLKDYLGNITMLDSSPEMVRIMNEKIESAGSLNLKAVLFDLEKNEPDSTRYDIVITQMALHHVSDIKSLIKKFYNMLNKGGFLAVADLYPEDGSFHGQDFNGHKGFDPNEMIVLARETGFRNACAEKSFTINKKISESETRQYDVFLLVAQKS